MRALGPLKSPLNDEITLYESILSNMIKIVYRSLFVNNDLKVYNKKRKIQIEYEKIRIYKNYQSNWRN